nr:hypothetical protein [Modestobacter marinus]
MRRSAGGRDTSLLLDATPSRRAQWSVDRATALVRGVPVPISGGDFTITVTSVTPSGATVEVATRTHPVTVRWNELGGAGGALGARTSALTCGLVARGCSQHFVGGSIYWSPGTGARTVTGVVRDRWAAGGSERGLGYPVSDTFCGLVGGGCFQWFQGGSLYSATAGGSAHVVFGAIRDRWGASGWEVGALGYPVADEHGTRGGSVQRFQRGAVYWSPATGARVVLNGSVQARWRASGAYKGALGYPVSDTFCGLVGGGCFQWFQGGSLYSATAGGSAHVVFGAIRDRWGASGWEVGALGYPVADEHGTRGGSVQRFQRGAVYWSPATGARVVLNGSVQARWRASGAYKGALGYPVSDTFCGLVGGGCFQWFQGGSLYSATAGGSAHVVFGAIRDRWGASGWEVGALGYPVADEQSVRGGSVQRFQRGRITWTPSRGAVVVLG